MFKENQSSPLLQGMVQLEEKYDAFLIDLWGVMHDGVNPYPHAVECVNQLIKAGKKIIFLSNAPRPGFLSAQQLIRYGLLEGGFEVVTSGDLVRDLLSRFEEEPFIHKPKKLYHVGANRNSDILKEIAVEAVSELEEASFVLITAFAEENEDINQYEALFKKAIALNIPAICANPDKEVIHGNGYRYCAGVFSEQYEKLGGKVHYYGKPHQEVYHFAIQRLNRSASVPLTRILMIGDTLETDILGARNAGLDSLLVLSGNMGNRLKRIEDKPLAEKVSEVLAQYGITPTWILNQLS